MAKARHRWLALRLNVREFTMNDLSFDNDGLKVSNLVLKLTFGIFSAEIVNSLLNRVALQSKADGIRI